MIDGKYAVEVSTPIGKKMSSVELKTKGDDFEVIVDAPVIGKQKTTAKVDGNSFTASGKVRVFLVGKVTYALECTVADDVLTGTLNTSQGSFPLLGVRV